ncbi:MAG: SDR family oxidoreductase [Haloarculaceae archaeon]
MTLDRGTALVTGASAGIGKALTERFASEGHDVVLVARREERLRAVADGIEDAHGVAAHVVPADLSNREDRADLYAEVTGRGIEVDYLVNNAGVGTQGKFTEIDLDRDLDLVELNVAAPTHLSKLFVRDMVERGGGGVLTVASTAAFQPGPYMATYYASKAYELSFSQALHEELRGDGVTATVLCSGPVATEFQGRADMTDAPIGRQDGGLIRWMEADDVARMGYRGLAEGRAVVVPGTANRVVRLAAKLLPSSLARKLAMRVNRG